MLLGLGFRSVSWVAVGASWLLVDDRSLSNLYTVHVGIFS